MKLSLILKGILIYIIFVIGLGILIEWLECKKIPDTIDSSIERFLRNLKKEIKHRFLKEKFVDIPTRPLRIDIPVVNSESDCWIPPRQQTVRNLDSDEEILKTVNERLKFSDMTFSSNTYANLHSNSRIPLANSDDYSYSPVTYQTRPQLVLNTRDNYTIDSYKYTNNFK